jgi:hypothetical protein
MPTRCTATTKGGTPCLCWAIPGTKPPTCLFHCPELPEAVSRKPRPFDREREIALLEGELRTVRHLRASLERTRTIIALVELIEELRKPDEKEKPWTPPRL